MVAVSPSRVRSTHATRACTDETQETPRPCFDAQFDPSPLQSLQNMKSTEPKSAAACLRCLESGCRLVGGIGGEVALHMALQQPQQFQGCIVQRDRRSSRANLVHERPSRQPWLHPNPAIQRNPVSANAHPSRAFTPVEVVGSATGAGSE